MSSDTLPRTVAVRSVDDVVDALRSVPAGGTVDVVGAGRHGCGNPIPPADLVIDTRGLDRVIEHAAGDLVVTVQAGVTLEQLQSELAGAKQWLALDPPFPEGTVGGIVAAAASGPRRLRWGTPRDLVIGMTVVLADGTVARSGGKVVKNVAGYDLGKLFTGSFGTLGVIAELTFRLHPRPAALRTVTARAGEVATAVKAVKASGAQASAIEWDADALTVVVEGSDVAAQGQAERIASILGGEVGDHLPAGFGELPWQPSGGDVGLKVTYRLGALTEALGAIDAALPTARIRAHAGSGVIWVGAAAGDLEAVAGLRDAVAAIDGQVVVAAAPDDVKRGVDVWGPVRGLEVMRRVKEQFDPDRRMAPGRFVGGL